MSSRRAGPVLELEGSTVVVHRSSDQATVEPMMDKLIDATYLQVFEYGFFHGDPHPGNLMLLDDGRLAYLDFGVTGTLTGKMQDTLMSLFMALVYRDAESVAMTLYRAGATDDRVDSRASPERSSGLSPSTTVHPCPSCRTAAPSWTLWRWPPSTAFAW